MGCGGVDGGSPRSDFEAAGFVRVAAVVADGVLVLRWDVLDGGSEEAGGGEDLEIAFGAPTGAGAVDDALGFLDPGDLFQGEGRAEQVFGELLAANGSADGSCAGIEAEAAVFPCEELAEFFFADELLGAQDGEKAVAEDFSERFEGFDGKFVEGAVSVVKAGGGEDVKVGMEDEVVTEGLDGGDGGELAVGEVEAGAEPIAQGFDGGAEKQVEEVASLAEDAAQGPGHGEDELAVGDVVAEGVADPVASGADAALMAGGAEVATLAGKGEELFVAAIGALKAGETSGEVTAAVEAIDDGDGIAAEGSVDPAMAVLVGGEEFAPGVVDDLPQGRGAGPAGTVDGGHNACS